MANDMDLLVIDKLNRLFDSFNTEMVPDLGAVTFRTGDLVKDAFMYYCETTYGIKIQKTGKDGWIALATDDPRCTFLVLQV